MEALRVFPFPLGVIFVVSRRKQNLIFFFNYSYASFMWSCLDNILELNFVIKDWSDIWKLFYIGGS